MKFIKSLSHAQLAVLALILANLIWGAASPIFKWSLQNIPLFMLAFFRFFGAALLLLPFVWKTDLHIAKRDVFKLVALSVCGITINIIFFFLGLQRTSSINAPIIASSGPVFLLIAAFLFLHERPKSKTVMGTLVSLLGVFVIVGRPLLEQGFDWTAFEGNLFFIIATIGAVGQTVISKNILHRYDALTITFWSFVIGSLTFFPFFAWETVTHPAVMLNINGVVGLIFGIVLSSTVGYSFYTWAIKQIDASQVGVFAYIDPVVATVIAIPLLGEVITPLFIIGAALVFSGIFVAEGRIHYHPFNRLRFSKAPNVQF